MDDELLARAPALIGMVPAGVDEGFADALAVDGDGRLVGVLLHDGEQVAEQTLFEVAEHDRGPALRLLRLCGIGRRRVRPGEGGATGQRRTVREHGAVGEHGAVPERGRLSVRLQFARRGCNPLRNR